MYLYVWYLLALLAWLLRRMDYAFFWAVLSGLYGLCFGGLCAAVYLFAKTPAFALSWWLSGLSYDALHGIGNFVLMLLLYRPLRRALQMAKKSSCGSNIFFIKMQSRTARGLSGSAFIKNIYSAEYSQSIAAAIQDRFTFILAKACRTSPEKYSVPSAHTGPSPPSSSARATPASMLSAASAVQP